jgi:hemerythrin-like metal-binding protein
METGAQDQPLTSKVLELHAALIYGQPWISVAAILDEVEAFAVNHLAEEESRIAATHFPWVMEHIRQHQAFRRRLRVLRVHLLAETARPLLAAMVKESLVDWWQDHVAEADRRFALFSRQSVAN